MLSIACGLTSDYHWTSLARGSCSFSSNSFISVVASLQSDVRELFIYRYPVIVQAGRLQDDPGRPHHHRHGEDPEEQPVKDHRHVLPVLLGLGGVLLGPGVLGYEVDTDTGLVHCRGASGVVKRGRVGAPSAAGGPWTDTVYNRGQVSPHFLTLPTYLETLALPETPGGTRPRGNEPSRPPQTQWESQERLREVCIHQSMVCSQQGKAGPRL